MNANASFQKLDPASNAYRWYRISLKEPAASQLFRQHEIVIEFGRIGQAGRSMCRWFDDDEAARQFYDKEVHRRTERGYVRVARLRDVRLEACRLCTLLDTGESDPTFVKRLARSVVFVNWDQTYHGRLFLVFDQHIPDFFHLATSDMLTALRDIRMTERALHDAFGPERLNYLFMGNQAGHVHLHVVPRYHDDPRRSCSPFLETTRTMGPQMKTDDYARIAEKVRAALVDTN